MIGYRIDNGDLYFSNLNLESGQYENSSRLDWTSKNVSKCYLEEFPAIALNDDSSIAYTLTTYYDFSSNIMLFIPMLLKDGTMMGTIYKPSVNSTKSYHLFYNSGIVYGIFHTFNERIFIKYDSVNDIFIFPIYQLVKDYTRVFISDFGITNQDDKR